MTHECYFVSHTGLEQVTRTSNHLVACTSATPQITKQHTAGWKWTHWYPSVLIFTSHVFFRFFSPFYLSRGVCPTHQAPCVLYIFFWFVFHLSPSFFLKYIDSSRISLLWFFDCFANDFTVGIIQTGSDESFFLICWLLCMNMRIGTVIVIVVYHLTLLFLFIWLE